MDPMKPSSQANRPRSSCSLQRGAVKHRASQSAPVLPTLDHLYHPFRALKVVTAGGNIPACEST
jgi:hypothetical protein